MDDWVLLVAPNRPQKRELDWLLSELHETLASLKSGLEECYALLAPIEPGSTLVLSTPRNELVKGHVTRVGTRIVKGVRPVLGGPEPHTVRLTLAKQTVSLRLRTLPPQTLTIDPDRPIHLAALATLHALLTDSVDLLGITMSYLYPSDAPPVSSPPFLATQLRLLAESVSEASALLKGTANDAAWGAKSAGPSHFSSVSSSSALLPVQTPQGPASDVPALSFYLGIQESCLVLWLRALEPADAPVYFGTKLALAIGTSRRLEHDELDKVFGFVGEEEETKEHGQQQGGQAQDGQHQQQQVLSGKRLPRRKEVSVYVREKVRVESADPSLLVLAAKLAALGHTLALARRNLAAVMGDPEED